MHSFAYEFPHACSLLYTPYFVQQDFQQAGYEGVGVAAAVVDGAETRELLYIPVLQGAEAEGMDIEGAEA